MFQIPHRWHRLHFEARGLRSSNRGPGPNPVHLGLHGPGHARVVWRVLDPGRRFHGQMVHCFRLRQ